MVYSLERTAQSHTVDLPAGRFHYLSWGAERTERLCCKKEADLLE